LTKLLAPLGLFLEQLDKGKVFSDCIMRKVSARKNAVPLFDVFDRKRAVYIAVDRELTFVVPIFRLAIGQILVPKSSFDGW